MAEEVLDFAQILSHVVAKIVAAEWRKPCAVIFLPCALFAVCRVCSKPTWA